MDEEEDAKRPVGRQVQLVERLDAPPVGDVGRGEVQQAGLDVLLEQADRLAHEERRGEAQHDRLGGTLDDAAEDAARALAAGSLRHHGCRAAARADVDLEVPGARAAVDPAASVARGDGQVPRVDAVLLEEDDRVLFGGDVDVERQGARGTGLPAKGPRARRHVDALDVLEPALAQGLEQGVLARLRLEAGLARECA